MLAKKPLEVKSKLCTTIWHKSCPKRISPRISTRGPPSSLSTHGSILRVLRRILISRRLTIRRGPSRSTSPLGSSSSSRIRRSSRGVVPPSRRSSCRTSPPQTDRCPSNINRTRSARGSARRTPFLPGRKFGTSRRPCTV